MPVEIDKGTALVIVDVQRDFCPGGSLPVPEGDRVVPVLSQYIEKFRAAKAPIFITRDWHPPNHVSFKNQGGPWPPHCVQGTEGARLHPDLTIPPNAEILSKADSPEVEAYSIFQQADLDLASKLRRRGIETLLVGGLATDYCVKSTVLDGLEKGFEVYHLDDASRGVDVNPGDTDRALREMTSKGTKRITIKDVLPPQE